MIHHDASQEIILILARADNGVIGKDGTLPWHLAADLKHFKALTMGKPMVMGRKTFESLPGLLPGRRHIVLTRDENWIAEGAKAVTTVKDAVTLANAPEIAVIGGAEIYRLFLPHATRIELTEVHMDADGDTEMQDFPPREWEEAARTTYAAEASFPSYSFVTLNRKSKN